MGKCVCPGATTACGTACVDTTTAVKNCGYCGHACVTGEVCTAGKCAPVCTAPESACGAACVNLATDPANCGACGAACPYGVQCSGGACVTPACAGVLGMPGLPLVDAGGGLWRWPSRI
jgi:hypothetical protein